jgi:23S rRNA (adenine2030-N6)-methyltransferase
MNYRHVFHAGNFADVFKHAVLALLLQSLAAKGKPFVYLETHAGSGRYDLESEAARKTGEARAGIGRLWPQRENFPELAEYFSAVAALNRTNALRFYPGSPKLARTLLRAQDRMALFELMPEECARLRDEFARDDNVQVFCQDGYGGLKAQLPPRERRGLVLIDPPYEAATGPSLVRGPRLSPIAEAGGEFTQAFEALKLAHARWATGIFALWYPVKERAPAARLHRRLTASGIRKILCAELMLYPEDTAFRLNGSGMIVVNPPWKLDETLRDLLPRLLRALQDGEHTGRAGVSWLVPE